MEGLVTLLDSTHNAEVEALWAELAEECGIEHPLQGPAPHFSWHVAWTYRLPELEQQLREFAAAQPAFSTSSSGLGLFCGAPQWVLYIPVIKNQELLDLHARLWSLVSPFAERALAYYAPHAWQPHITLSMLPADLPDGLEAGSPSPFVLKGSSGRGLGGRRIPAGRASDMPRQAGAAERLGRAVERLVERKFDWEIQVDHLALLSETGGRCLRIPFGELE